MKKPYLPLGQVRLFWTFQRCGVKRFVPACVGSIAYLAGFVKGYAVIRLIDLTEMRLSILLSGVLVFMALPYVPQ